nr:GspH/FimT family pseudopilin [Caldimonas mangrovi]
MFTSDPRRFHRHRPAMRSVATGMRSVQRRRGFERLRRHAGASNITPGRATAPWQSHRKEFVMYPRVFPSRRAVRGLTLVELMVVIAVVTILGTLSSGSMQALIDRTRLESSTFDFLGDLQFARSEAITRGLPVSICPSSDGAACAEGDAWHLGWIVFVDAEGDGSVSDPALVLRRRLPWHDRYTLVSEHGTGILSFGRDGFLLRLSVSEAQLRAEASGGSVWSANCITINRAGRHRVERAGTGSCA